MATSREFRAAKRLMQDVSDITFEPASFGHVLAQDNPIIQARVMAAFLGFVYVMAAKMEDTKAIDDTVVTAARIRDALEVYRGASD